MPNREYCVYGLFDEGKFLRYIGKAEYATKHKRLYRHLNDFTRTHKSNWIQKLVKQGKKPILEVLIRNLSEQEALEEEKFLISYMTFIGCDLTNATEGGDGISGYTHTPIARQKMSEKRKGSKHHFWAIPRELNPNVGKKRTPEQCARIAKSLTGKKLSEEHKKTLSLSHKGLGKSVNQLSIRGLVSTYKTTKEASEKTGIDSSAIGKCCRGTRKTAGGFKWEHC